jgi:hypothetical protein
VDDDELMRKGNSTRIWSMGSEVKLDGWKEEEKKDGWMDGSSSRVRQGTSQKERD